MKVVILEEHGIDFAFAGLGLSFSVTSSTIHEGLLVSPDDPLFDRMMCRAEKLSGLGGGHDKFLRSIMVNMAITAPMYWWKQFDTYKVGTVTQSESTMHTLMVFPINARMFEGEISPVFIKTLEDFRLAGDFDALNRHLPQSFLQTRAVSTNYAALQNIIRQRQNYKLPEWSLFVEEVLNQCRYPKLLWPDRLRKS